MKPVTAVAISGGIDSLVAAHLLLEKGHRVVGIHFLTGFEGQAPGRASPAVNQESASGSPMPSHPIHLIADQLGIPVHIVDLKAAFENHVITYFIQSYAAGHTPNPCLKCNAAIKFGPLLASARQLGASHLATGHYIRKSRDTKGRHHLLKGLDPEKDQSYFLAFLSQSQIAAARFPLGGMTKQQVKALARSKGLVPIQQEESQDICFIKDKAYTDFLRQRGVLQQPGPITDVKGNVLGQHKGLHGFTIGQRRGIDCPAPDPYYVLRLDTERNRLVVGSRKDLYSDACRVAGINWIGEAPNRPIRVMTKIRYSHPGAQATLFPGEGDQAVLRFDEKQSAITPGQGAVFYQGEEVMGGGWIEGT